MSEISDKCETIEVPNLNTKGDPSIKTEVLQYDGGRGAIVARTTSFARGMPTTKYGLLVQVIPWEESKLAAYDLKEAADYEEEYHPAPRPDKDEVYVVKCAVTEEDKSNLALILRKECGKYGKIDFF